MWRYLLQRVLGALITILGVLTIVFLLLRLIPGDPARLVAGLTASQEEVEAVRQRLGMNESLLVQYAIFLGNIVQGDLGTSLYTNKPVMNDIAERLPYTFQLALVTMALTMLFGLPLGILAATHEKTWMDYVISVGSLLGISLPSYALGLLLIVIFAVQLKWLPAAGASDGIRSLILPSFTLSLIFLAVITRITRGAMLEALRQDYVRTARAKGLPARQVLTRHALRNALLPVVTVLGLQFGGLMSGAVLTETVFGWPGVGLLLTDSIFNRDYPMVQGVVLFIAVVFVFVNLAVDLLYAAIDPRIRYG
jgi:ABC-type dipeptide/oligopeptide/nickel transport system permease component